jgi:4-hydroxyphenylpyruvate dioxygenase
MSYRPAIASMSLGVRLVPSPLSSYTNTTQRAWLHQLPQKFTAASQSGLPGIEIFFEDLAYLASSLPGGFTPTNQLLAAHQIRRLCDSLHLELMGLGPFKDCEGLLDPVARAEKLEELKLWFEMARILGTDIIQIPCTFMTEGITGDRDIIARDLRQIADLGAMENPPFRFAYENLCFGTHNDTWEKAWDIVERVDRPNFGICLDTFNIAGRAWADPASPTGCVENADEVFKASMRNMVKTIDVRKVFYVQVVDAERLRSPLDTKHAFHVDGQMPRMSWSRNSRLFMCEEDRGGYLPVVDILKAICDEKEGLGYKGWVSMELFNRSLTKENPAVPVEHADRAMESWRKLVKAMGWEGKADAVAIPARSTSKTVAPSVEEVGITARL